MKVNDALHLEQMKQELINYNDQHYREMKREFIFADNVYKTSVNFAYLNAKINDILVKYNIPFDESWMWTQKMSYSNSTKVVHKLVKRLFDLRVPKEIADDLMIEVVNVVNEMVNHFNNGSKVSLDVSLIGICQDIIHNKEIHDLLMNEHVNDDMTPEEIYAKKDVIVKQLKTLPIYGIKELLLSESGVKVDQVFNALIGLWLRARIHDETGMNEIAPRLIKERWVDGITTRDTHFIETNINRQSVIVSKQTIKDSGVENKMAGILAQDTYISEHDCGSIHGVWVEVGSQEELNNLHYKYQIMEDGSLRTITPGDTHLIGTKIKIRSVLTCASKHGICEKCFGEHAFYNKHTRFYRKDLGAEFTKYEISPASQEVLSLRHNVTPELIPPRFILTNVTTGELTDDINEIHKYMEQKFDKIIPKEGVKFYFKAEDITNTVYNISKGKELYHLDGNIKYKDTEYNDFDIIRVRRIYLFTRGNVFTLELESTITKMNKIIKPGEFKLKGFPAFNTKEDPGYIPLEGKEVSRVIMNRSKTSRFKNLKSLYISTSSNVQNNDKEDKHSKYMNIDTLEELVAVAKSILPRAHMSAIEVLFRNKVKSKDNDRFTPDWTKPEAINEYVILSEKKSIISSRSLSSKLGLGFFKQRVNDPMYYSPEVLTPSAYDLLFDTDDEIDAKNKYVEITEEFDYVDNNLVGDIQL